MHTTNIQLTLSEECECGQYNSDDEFEDAVYSKALTLCKWSKKIRNVIKIARGYQFNIYTAANKDNEFILTAWIYQGMSKIILL